MRQIVSEEAIQAAFDYLNEQGAKAAQAKADIIIAEFRRKRVRAQLILASKQTTAVMREADAESHPDYWEACQQEAEAAQAMYWHQHQRVRSDAIIEAWRTEQSNSRSLSRVA